MSEQTIQRKIRQDFEERGAYSTKVNPGIYGAPTGHADLVLSIPVTIPGSDYFIIPICLYIEVKTKTGKQSMMQKIWMREMLKAGHLVCVARCTQDALEYLASQGIKL